METKRNSFIINHDVKLCMNEKCNVIVVNENWKEIYCRQCGSRTIKINAKTFNKKFKNYKQVLYFDL